MFVKKKRSDSGSMHQDKFGASEVVYSLVCDRTQ